MQETTERPISVGIVVAPQLLLMDVVGAQSVFAFTRGAKLYYVGKTKEVVSAWGAFPVAATTSFDECPPLDVVIVGAMAPDVYSDAETLDFIKKQSSYNPYLIGICAGVLLLGAAGLLKGKRATTNLHITDRLGKFGCDVVEGGSVVEDGKLFTAGPATGSFEAGLLVLSRLRGEHAAKLMELNLEYHPMPIFGVGTAALAGPALTQEVRAFAKPFFDMCVEAAVARYQAL